MAVSKIMVKAFFNDQVENASCIILSHTSKATEEKLAAAVALLKEKGIVPCLAVIQVGNDQASSVYVNNKKKACEELGIQGFDSYLEGTTAFAFGMEDETCAPRIIKNQIKALNKMEIKAGVAKEYNVTVEDVRVLTRKGKKTRFSRGKHAYPGTTFRQDHKFAYVTLKEGDKIAVFEEEETSKPAEKADKKAEKKAEKKATKAEKKGDK